MGADRKTRRDNRTLAWALREVAVTIQDAQPTSSEGVAPYTREAWRLAYRVVCAEVERLEVESKGLRFKVKSGVKKKAQRARPGDPIGGRRGGE